MSERDTHRVGEHVVKTPASQVEAELQSVKVTLSGASHAVDLETVGLTVMRDTSYRVVLTGEFAAPTRVDESTITETGFTVIGGAAAEVAHILIHGAIRDRVR